MHWLDLDPVGVFFDRGTVAAAESAGDVDSPGGRSQLHSVWHALTHIARALELSLPGALPFVDPDGPSVARIPIISIGMDPSRDYY